MTIALVMTMSNRQCRLCLEKDQFQIPIFLEDYHCKQILFKIQTCLPIKVEKGDGLPNTICYKCLANLDSSFELWNKSFNSEAILKYNLCRGRVNPFLDNITGHRNKDDTLSKYDTTLRSSRTEIRDHMEFDWSQLDGLDEKICNLVDSDLENFHKHTKKLIRYDPNGETYDMLSDLSEFDENSQTTINLPYFTHPHNDKQTAEKERDNQSQSQSEDEIHMNADWKNKSKIKDTSAGGQANKYIYKNLFNGQSDTGNGMLRNQQLDNDLNSNLFLNNNKKNLDAGKTAFDWTETSNASEKKSKQNKISDQLGIENEKTCNIQDFKSKENSSINKLLYDLNYCPKCKKIFTPSQNVLLHIQSHNE